MEKIGEKHYAVKDTKDCVTLTPTSANDEKFENPLFVLTKRGLLLGISVLYFFVMPFSLNAKPPILRKAEWTKSNSSNTKETVVSFLKTEGIKYNKQALTNQSAWKDSFYKTAFTCSFPREKTKSYKLQHTITPHDIYLIHHKKVATP